jgi:hypothetical protein
MSALLAAAAATNLLIAPAQPGGYRAIDYAALTPEMVAEIAADLKITDVSPAPARGIDLAVEAAPAADHQQLALGNYCSGAKLANPAGEMLRRLAAEADRDGSLGVVPAVPLLTLKLDSARSNRRCVEVGEMNVRCITRVTLVGEAVHRGADGSERRQPLRADVERDSSVGGFCGGVARALAVVTREAGQQFLKQALD